METQHSEGVDKKKDESEKIAENASDENEVKRSEREKNVSGSQSEKDAKTSNKPSKKREVSDFSSFFGQTIKKNSKLKQTIIQLLGIN